MRIALCAVLALVALGYAQEKEKPPKPDPKKDALALIEKGRTAIAADKITDAIDHLQAAIDKLQTLVAKGLVAWLPKAPTGWKREEPKLETGSWGGGGQSMQWNAARCRYLSENGRLVINAQLSTQPKMLEATRQAAQMYANAELVKMINNDPDTTIESLKEGEWVGWIISQKGRDASLVAMTKKVMLSLSVNSDSIALLKPFWAAFDNKGCAAANP